MTGALTDELEILVDGELEISGRVLPASNITFYGTVTRAGRSMQCVYKPVRGERPLWDFPDGTLASREVAAYVVSEALGWSVVPPTVLRDGPAGPGMVQAWREPDPGQDPVDVVAGRTAPPGYLHVLDATDDADRPVSVVHEDTDPLRRMAVFDVVTNNADRKGGHVLPMPDGHRFGVDHGVCFHCDPKLRTVLWGWAGRALHPADAADLRCLAERLASTTDELTRALAGLLAPEEVEALRRRCRRLLARDRMPSPTAGWRAIPWPPF